jgi:hypothetical protein
MTTYRVWAIDKSTRSIVVEAESQHDAERQAQELIQLGEWEERVEQDGGAVCEWEIMAVAQIPKQ